MTDAVSFSATEIVELYSLRWQIELFFKELKSTLHFAQYRFRKFQAVEAWAETAITTVLYLEWTRARQLARRGLSEADHRRWQSHRLHGLCEAFHQRTQRNELRYLAERLKTKGGLQKLKRQLNNASPEEYRS